MNHSRRELDRNNLPLELKSLSRTRPGMPAPRGPPLQPSSCAPRGPTGPVAQKGSDWTDAPGAALQPSMSDRAWPECALRGRPTWQRPVPLVCCPPARALVLRFTRPLLPFLQNSDRRMLLFFNRPLDVLFWTFYSIGFL